MKLVYAVLLAAAVLVTGCGGGSGKGSGDDSSQPSDTSEKTVDYAVSSDVNLTMDDNFKVVSSVSSGDNGTVERQAKDTIAVIKGDELFLMAPVFESDADVVISYETTAVAYVLMDPGLLGMSAEGQEAAVDIIKNSEYFDDLTLLIKTNIENGSAAPLDPLVYPLLSEYTVSIIQEINKSPKMRSVLYKAAEYRAAKAASLGDDQFTADVASGVMTVSNPKAVFYTAYADSDTLFDTVAAKEGLVNLSFSADWPYVGARSTEESRINLSMIHTNSDSVYPVTLVRGDAGSLLQPSTAEGAAAWYNTIKGFGLLVEGLGVKADYTNSTKLRKILYKAGDVADVIQENLSDATAIIGSVAYIAREINEQGGINDPEISNICLTIQRIADYTEMFFGSLPDSAYKADAIVKDIYGEDSLNDLIKKIKTGDSGTIAALKTHLLESLDSGTASFNCLIAFTKKDVSDYSFWVKKLSSFYGMAETYDLDDAVMEMVADSSQDFVKAALKNIAKRVFGSGFAIAAYGNKLIPYAYDMVTAPEDIKFFVKDGNIEDMSIPSVGSVIIKVNGTEAYNTNTGKTDPIIAGEGDTLTVSFTANAPGYDDVARKNADVGFFIEIGEMLAAQADVRFQYSDPVSAGKSVELAYRQYLYISKDNFTSSPDWTRGIQRYGESSSETTFSDDDFSKDVYFKEDSFGSEFTVVLPHDVRQLDLYLSTFAAYMNAKFTIPVVKSGAPKVSITSIRTEDDPSKYVFKAKATDDNTSSVNMKYYWDFGDGNVLDGESLVSHTYSSVGEKTVSVVVTDEDGNTATETVEVYPTSSSAVFTDVVFLVDVSGSYDDDLGTFKNLGTSIIGALSTLGANVQVGVASFSDYPQYPYGESYDYSFRYDSALSYITGKSVDAINALGILNGYDSPESQLEALYQLATSDGWLEQAQKIIFLVTDDSFHNSDVETDYPGHGYTETLAALNAKGIKVVGLIPTSYTINDVSQIASDTGGMVVNLGASSSGIVDAIMNLSSGKSKPVKKSKYVVGTSKPVTRNR
jgi:PKD repeat protein